MLRTHCLPCTSFSYELVNRIGETKPAIATLLVRSSAISPFDKRFVPYQFRDVSWQSRILSKLNHLLIATRRDGNSQEIPEIGRVGRHRSCHSTVRANFTHTGVPTVHRNRTRDISIESNLLSLLSSFSPVSYQQHTKRYTNRSAGVEGRLADRRWRGVHGSESRQQEVG